MRPWEFLLSLIKAVQWVGDIILLRSFRNIILVNLAATVQATEKNYLCVGDTLNNKSEIVLCVDFLKHTTVTSFFNIRDFAERIKEQMIINWVPVDKYSNAAQIKRYSLCPGTNYEENVFCLMI